MEYPAAFQELIAALRQLPSVGPRSAERLALYLMENDASISHRLATALTCAKEQIRPCPQCGFFSQGDLCAICRDSSRDTGLWCVVEHAGDMLKLEKSGTWRGLYHILGGRLSPLDGIGPEQLAIAPLLARISQHSPREIVLALGADVEGETTALYLAPLLKEKGVKVSRLATGLPAGGGLEFADSVTLGYALAGRREI
jgi:recombination protein RecR